MLILNNTYLGSATLYKLGMTMNEHILLKNNKKYIKNIKFIKYFKCGENY